MNEHILTIIDTKGELRELNLDHFRKSDITLGRDASRCDIVIPDQIVSKADRSGTGIWTVVTGLFWESDPDGGYYPVRMDLWKSMIKVFCASAI